LAQTHRAGFNWLANTGLLPDGSLDPEDVATLGEVGAKLRAEEFPGESDYQKNRPLS